jgi:hypothetical protein
VSNSTPSTPPADEQTREQAEAALEEEPKAAEDWLLELKREVEEMLEAERVPAAHQPGWKQDGLPISITQKEALKLHERWLDVQCRRYQEQPERYGPVRTHNGWNIACMLAYCADKMLRVREIREETETLRDRRPSPRTAKLAAEIARGCEALKDIYSMTGDHYGQGMFPPKEKFRGLR